MILPSNTAWWKSYSSMSSVCFLLLLLLGQPTCKGCGVSTETVTVPSIVEDTAGALQLADAMDCVDGGSFDVEWIGFVSLETAIVVKQNTVLSVTGAEDGSSWVDGANEHSLFEVEYGGGLFLSSLTLSRGKGFYGGAVEASYSNVIAVNCIFINNSATFGGAIFLSGGNLVLSDTNFSRNSAEDSGGAIYGQSSATVIANGNDSWDANTAIYGGAIRLYSFCVFEISGSAAFTRNVADQGGGIWLSEGTDMTISGSAIFNENVGRDGGGLLVFSSFARFLVGSMVHFSNNTALVMGAGMLQFASGAASLEGQASFTNNIAQTGGAMRVNEGAGATISGEVTMSGNVALSSGGAIYCEATSELEIYNAHFILNYAGSSGGAIAALSSGTRTKQSIISGCSFEDNNADDAGGALFIAGGFVDINDSTFTQNTAGRSGGAVLASGVLNINYCLFENNRAYTGPAMSNTVSVFISWTEFDDNALLCHDGYFLESSTNVSAYDTACNACQAEEDCENCIVQNRDEVLVCEPVLAHTTSASANDTLQSLKLQEGYWRISTDSKDIRECYESSACIGGLEPYCSAGYTGPYCAVCKDGYARGLGNACLKCSHERRNAVIVVAVVIFVLIVMVIIAGIRSLTHPGEEHNLPLCRMMKAAISRFKGARAYQALKIMVVSWQIVTQFSGVASVTYPEVYDVFLGYVDVFNLNLGWMVSAGCLVNTSFYADLFISTVGPMILLLLVLASYRFSSLRYPPDNNQAHSRLLTIHGAILFWISFLVYSTTSSSIFQVFACDKLDNGKSYLRSDYNLECYTVEHKIIMSYAGVMSILYPFGIPFCYGLVLHRNRSKLTMELSRETYTNLATFKDLWRPYRPEVYFYEVIECLRRVVLSGIVVFVFPNTAGQVALTFLFALVFFAVLMTLNPYMNPWDAWLARFGHAIVMMSMFVALLQKVDTSDDDMFSQNVFGAVLVAANCVMILAVGAEACGLCFVTVRELGYPIQPINHQGVTGASITENAPADISTQGLDLNGELPMYSDVMGTGKA